MKDVHFFVINTVTVDLLKYLTRFSATLCLFSSILQSISKYIEISKNVKESNEKSVLLRLFCPSLDEKP